MKGFRGMKQDLKSYELKLKIWLWKGREDDEMSRDYRRIRTSQLKESTKR